MSGVYQALRKKSTFQVFEDCTSLRNKLTEYILQDFDLNGKLKDKHLFFLEEERKTILTYVRNVSTSIAMANSIYITNLEEYKERRLWQDRAIGWCGSLKQELQYIIKTLNKEINTNKYTDLCLDIDKEINLIRSWRQSENHFKTEFKEELG